LEQVPKTDSKVVTALERKSSTVEDPLLVEEDGAVKLECQECGKE
jgi:hypothetical protein